MLHNPFLCFISFDGSFNPYLKHVQQSRANWGSHSEIAAFYTSWNVQQFFKREMDSDVSLWVFCAFVLFFWGCDCINMYLKYTCAFLSNCAYWYVWRSFNQVLASFLLSTDILSWCNKSNYQRPLPHPRDKEESICYCTHAHTRTDTQTQTPSNTVQYVFTITSTQATEWQPG